MAAMRDLLSHKIVMSVHIIILKGVLGSDVEEMCRDVIVSS